MASKYPLVPMRDLFKVCRNVTTASSIKAGIRFEPCDSGGTAQVVSYEPMSGWYLIDPGTITPGVEFPAAAVNVRGAVPLSAEMMTSATHCSRPYIYPHFEKLLPVDMEYAALVINYIIPKLDGHSMRRDPLPELFRDRHEIFPYPPIEMQKKIAGIERSRRRLRERREQQDKLLRELTLALAYARPDDEQWPVVLDSFQSEIRSQPNPESP